MEFWGVRQLVMLDIIDLIHPIIPSSKEFQRKHLPLCGKRIWKWKGKGLERVRSFLWLALNDRLLRMDLVLVLTG